MALVEWSEVPEILEEDSDGEDRRERNDYNIEQAVMDFVDEDHVLHNLYPETDDEEDEIQHSGKTNQRRCGVKRGAGNLYEGQFFFSGVAFKEAVLDYALKSGRNIKQNRYDKDNLGYNCAADGCCWRINCSTTGKNVQWQVKVFKNVHSCVPNGSCEMIKVPVIARLFVDKIREEPEYFIPMKIEELMMENWKINVSRSQCQAARNKTMRWIQREYDEQFSRLRDYGREIIASNKNSTVEIECVTNDEQFSRLRD